MNKTWVRVGAGVAGIGLCWPVMAGGFLLNEQDVATQGTSFAGRASTPQNAATVFNNPAGMSFLNQAQLTVGTVYLDLSSDIDTQQSTQPSLAGSVATAGENGGDMIPGKAIPFGYVVVPLNEQWTFGFGAYVPYGLITDYSSNFKGRFFGNYSDVEIFTAQPTLSYRFNDQWSVGLGVTYNRIKGELGSATPDPTGGVLGEGDVNVKGDDEAWGYNLGVMFRPQPGTTLGLAYRSKVDYTLKGDVKFDNVVTVAPGASVGSDASLDITLPETIEFSVTQALDERWTLMAGAAWTRWSQFDELDVENDIATINEQENWKNSWMYSVGASYQLTPAWVLRGGVAFDESPMDGDNRTPRVPTGDRWIYSVGAGWQPSETLTVDVSYTYFNENKASVDMEDASRGTYQADYDSDGHGFGTQVTWRF